MQKVSRKTIVVGVTVAIVGASCIAWYLSRRAAENESPSDMCRRYAIAVEAATQARDNLDRPTWEDLVKSHPILELRQDESNGRAVTFAHAMNMGLIESNTSPSKLKKMSFEACQVTYSCLFYSIGCRK